MIIRLTTCCLLIAATGACAMSHNPGDNNPQPYTPASWQESTTPEADAMLALENEDLRILAFARRNPVIPGIETAQIQAYKESCGVRFIEGMGDVIRSNEQLEQMQRAENYAKRYNAVIITECRPGR